MHLDAFSARNSVVFLCGEGGRLVHGFVAVAAGSFVVPFGHVFGTKLGGVLVWRRGFVFCRVL